MTSKEQQDEDSPSSKKRRGRVTPSQVTLNRTPTRQSAETRSRVIRAAIKCISEEGFQRANTNRIAKEAGLTWGVLQYHFGDKEGILNAILESTFGEYIDQLQEVSSAGGSVHEKLSMLINRVWALISQPNYLATIEIIQNVGRDPDSGIDSSRLLNFWAIEISELWQELFPDKDYDIVKSAAARHILFATLRGFADNKMLSLPEPADGYRAEFDALTDAMVFLLAEK